MLAITGAAKVFLYRDYINMQKSFEGITALIEEAFPDLLLTGSFFVFLNRRRDRMKTLYWDRDGFVIWYKLLEKGTFSSKHKSNVSITRTEFFMLLEGIQPKRIQNRWKNMPE